MAHAAPFFASCTHVFDAPLHTRPAKHVSSPEPRHAPPSATGAVHVPPASSKREHPRPGAHVPSQGSPAVGRRSHVAPPSCGVHVYPAVHSEPMHGAPAACGGPHVG